MADSDSWDLLDNLQAFIHAPSYHIILEVALIIWILRLLTLKSYTPVKTVLTEKEKEELVSEWTPEPLVPDVRDDEPGLIASQNNILSGKVGKTVTINGRDCINLITFNFLGMIGKSSIESVALEALHKYGVGSCGPRGFYGTVDVHLKLEEKLAAFLQCEEAIIYCYGFSAVASAIPAYAKRGDVIFCDEGVSFAIQKGVQVSRSKVNFFKHNDMEDLERLLMEQEKEDKKNPKKAKVTRRFLVIEGLYLNYGDICPLPKLVELKWKYKVRIFIDETMSFGVLGKAGKGVTEHFGIPFDEMDHVSASLENSIGSIGGFCAGKAFVIDHQRLSGSGYCFSASVPPMLASAAIQALHLMEESPVMFLDLQSKSEDMHQALSSINGLKLGGSVISPVKHLYLESPTGDYDEDLGKLQFIVDEARNRNIALTVSRYLKSQEQRCPKPSIRIAVSSEFTKEEIINVKEVLNEACAINIL